MTSLSISTTRQPWIGFLLSIAVMFLLGAWLPAVATNDPMPISIIPIGAVAFVSIPVWVPILRAWRGGAVVGRAVFIFFSAMAWAVSAMFVYRYLNAELDELPPRSETLVVTAKHLAGGRSSKPYRLQFSFKVNDRDLELAVSSEDYAQVQIGDRFTASIHEGAFGLRWISSYSRLRPGETPETSSRGAGSAAE